MKSLTYLQLEEEVERLRNVIRTGGAMYRIERAMLGIPGGHDPNEKIDQERFPALAAFERTNDRFLEAFCRVLAVSPRNPFTMGVGGSRVIAYDELHRRLQELNRLAEERLTLLSAALIEAERMVCSPMIVRKDDEG